MLRPVNSRRCLERGRLGCDLFFFLLFRATCDLFFLLLFCSPFCRKLQCSLQTQFDTTKNIIIHRSLLPRPLSRMSIVQYNRLAAAAEDAVLTNYRTPYVKSFTWSQFPPLQNCALTRFNMQCIVTCPARPSTGKRPSVEIMVAYM